MPSILQIPGRLDIVITKGDAFASVITFDVDVSTWTLAATVDTSSPTTITLDNSSGGTVDISLDATATGAIPAGEYTWHMDRSDIGFERRYLAGKFTVIVISP